MLQTPTLETILKGVVQSVPQIIKTALKFLETIFFKNIKYFRIIVTLRIIL